MADAEPAHSASTLVSLQYLVSGSRLAARVLVERAPLGVPRAVWGAVGVGGATLVTTIASAAGLVYVAGSMGDGSKKYGGPASDRAVVYGRRRLRLPQRAVTNAVWNHTHLGPHRFVSSLAFFPLLRLHATNFVAIVATVGLAIPWARVRLARYRPRTWRSSPPATSAVSGIRAGIDDEAFGSEAADAFDIAVGL